MKQRTTLTLVRNGGLIYPKGDADYEVLSALGVPMNNLSADFIPALLSYLPSTVKHTIVKFDELEAEMLERFETKWKREVIVTAKAVTLTYDKDTKEALVTKAIASLKRWYRDHFYKLESAEKRSGRNMKIVLTKVLTTRKET
jgi:hypothetical protein